MFKIKIALKESYELQGLEALDRRRELGLFDASVLKPIDSQVSLTIGENLARKYRNFEDAHTVTVTIDLTECELGDLVTDGKEGGVVMSPYITPEAVLRHADRHLDCVDPADRAEI